MEIAVLFDSHSRVPIWKTGFGLSLLIDGHVLFDTGSDGSAVLANLGRLGIPASRIDWIVLSHEHWDHTDGLPEILNACPKACVCACDKTMAAIADKLNGHNNNRLAADEPTEIAPDIWTSGYLKGNYKNTLMPEQALLVKGRGLVAGCAHFGIDTGLESLTETVKKCFGANAGLNKAVGGFHLSHESEEGVAKVAGTMARFGIESVAPMHCCGAIGKTGLKKHFKDSCTLPGVGETIEV